MEIIQNMPEKQYRDHPFRSQSDWKKMRAPTPRHAKDEMDNPKEADKTLVNGTCFHALSLENKKIYSFLPDFGDCRSKENKANKAEFLARHEGQILLSQDNAHIIEGMTKGIQENSGAKAILDSASHREISLFHEGGKCRIDFVFPLGIGDLKSTKGADLFSFSKSLEKYGYHIQAAHYLDMAAIAGFPCENFYIIAVENFAPFCCAIYTIGHQSLEIGRKELKRLRDLYESCEKSGIYPGYSEDAVEINLPIWKLMQEEKGEF